MIDAARTLFAERGYANVPADEIVRRAGVTRGALYHHYTDKQGLFREVFEQLEAEMTEEIASAGESAADLRAEMVLGVGRFLDICQRPEVLRIALTDAPAVLGWSAWREIEARHGLGLITGMLQAAAEAGLLVPTAIPVLAQLVMSAVTETALMIANAEDPDAMRAEAQQALVVLLSGLLKA